MQVFFDITARYVPGYGFLPLLRDDRNELYRGEFKKTPQAAFFASLRHAQQHTEMSVQDKKEAKKSLDEIDRIVSEMKWDDHVQTRLLIGFLTQHNLLQEFAEKIKKIGEIERAAA